MTRNITPPIVVSLEAFYDILDNHNWRFEGTDDTNVFTAGYEEWNRILAIAMTGEANGDMEYNRLLNAFHAWHHKSATKPQRPVEAKER